MRKQANQIPNPNSHYILVRTKRQEERDRREKKGVLHLPNSAVFMTRNLQHGEIVKIGGKAHAAFPEMKAGQTALVHHFVQAESEAAAKDEHLVHQDDIYNYYVVTVYMVAGKNAELYGIFDGEKIIPNPLFIFLTYIEPGSLDHNLEAMIAQSMTETSGGLLTFKKWNETREDKEQRMAELKARVESLSKSGNEKEHIRQEIQKIEDEMNKISAEINKRYFKPYQIAAFNPAFSEAFEYPVEVGDTIYTLEIASQTTIEFMGVEYRVVSTKIDYLAGIVTKQFEPELL